MLIHRIRYKPENHQCFLEIQKVALSLGFKWISGRDTLISQDIAVLNLYIVGSAGHRSKSLTHSTLGDLTKTPKEGDCIVYNFAEVADILYSIYGTTRSFLEL